MICFRQTDAFAECLDSWRMLHLWVWYEAYSDAVIWLNSIVIDAAGVKA